MPAGTWQIVVHIIEARELKGRAKTPNVRTNFTYRDDSGMSDPVVEVSVFGEEKCTDTKKRTTSCMFDHLMYFDVDDADERKVDAGKITIAVFDANTIKRNVLIGSFDMDCAYIRQQKDSEVYRRWVALIDTTDKFEGVQGYLKLSICIVAPGASPPLHELGNDDDDDVEEDDEKTGASLQSMILMPPTIKTQDYVLQLFMYRAENLMPADVTSKSSDPFVRVNYGALGKPLDTRRIKKSLSPEWNEELCVAVTTPTFSDGVEIMLMDDDVGGKDDLILQASKTASNPDTAYGKPFWLNFYGPPRGADGKLADDMARSHESGSRWHGRLLMAATVTAVAEAKAGKSTCAPPQQMPDTGLYQLHVDLYEVCELPVKEKLYVVAQLGSVEKRSEKASSKNGVATFGFGMDTIECSLPHDEAQRPDVFLHLFQKNTLTSDDRIAYVRLTGADLRALEAEDGAQPRWLPLRPDKFRSSMKEHELAGFLLAKVRFGDSSRMEITKRTAVSVPPKAKFEVRAHIYQASNLRAADRSGSSDPYCVVRCGKDSKKTKRLKQTTSPMWYETLQLSTQLAEPLSHAPDINVVVFDHDRDRDDVLGRFTVPLASLGATMPDTPQWYNLYEAIETSIGVTAERREADTGGGGGGGKKKRNRSKSKKDVLQELADATQEAPLGRVLASFQLLPAGEAAKVPLPASITPKFRDCILEVALVGLRNMMPHMLIPIINPQVYIDCGDRKSHEAKSEPCASPSGRNPNHLQVLRVPVKVPFDPMFAPPINVRVYDDRKIHKPLVATRSLPMAPFIPWEPVEPKARRKSNASSKTSSRRNTMVTKTTKRKARGFTERTVTIVDDIPGALEEADNDVDGDEEIAAYERPAHVAIDMPHGEEAPRATRWQRFKAQFKVQQVSDVQLRRLGNVMSGASRVKETLLDVNLDGVDGVDGDGEGRARLPHELEREFTEIPFSEFDLHRTKRVARRGARPEDVVVVVGSVKMQIRVMKASEAKSVEEPDLKKMFAKTPVVVRLYALRGMQLVPKGNSVESCDPYLLVSNRKMKLGDDDDCIKGTTKPGFFKCYELKGDLPKHSQLEVKVMDMNIGRADDEIGRTRIDLENRWHADEWRAMKPKPIELRTLWNAKSRSPQGRVEMYVDVLTPEEAAQKPADAIGPPPVLDYEMRIVIWNTAKVQFRGGEKMADIFVSCALENNGAAKTTDTHWRSENGEGMFNWRIVFPKVQLPLTTPPRLKVQVWDKDALNENDAVCEAVLSLKKFFKKAYKSRGSASLDRQWISMTHPNFEGEQGKVELQIDLLTKQQAMQQPAGEGRKDPNENPFLPKPNRPDTSFAFYRMDKMLSKVLWRKYKPYVMLCSAVCCCCMIIVALGVLSVYLPGI